MERISTIHDIYMHDRDNALKKDLVKDVLQIAGFDAVRKVANVDTSR